MSLEQALADCTAAINKLTAAFTAGVDAGAVAHPAAAPKEPPMGNVKAVKETPAQTAATEPAATQTTAEQAAAPEPKVESPAEKSPAPVEPLTKEARAEIMVAYAGKHGRDGVIALLSKFGATRASDIPAEKLAEFDAELKAGV